MFSLPVLSCLLWCPVLVAMCLLILPTGPRSFKMLSLSCSWLIALCAVALFWCLEYRDGTFQHVESVSWFASKGIHYSLGVDGISMLLISSVAIFFPVLLSEGFLTYPHSKGYIILMFVMQTALFGTFMATDMILFYVFWELLLFPMFFFVGVWGEEHRARAGYKFLIYTLVGTAFMFVAMLLLGSEYLATNGVWSFQLQDFYGFTLSLNTQLALFLCFLTAMAVKIPIFPLHTWLPEAQKESPVGAGILFAAILFKVGLYGLIRFAYPLFPAGAEILSPLLALLALMGIVYGGLVAYRQTDLRKLIAYSSVSHLALCVVGICTLNVIAGVGAVYHAIAHAIATGGIFFMTGLLMKRIGTTEIGNFRGLAQSTPRLAFCFFVFLAGYIAVPFTNGFVGELLIFLGASNSMMVIALVALSGVVVGAVYMLKAYMNIFFGKGAGTSEYQDITFAEYGCIIPLLILTVLMGVFPQPVIERVQPAVERYLSFVQDGVRHAPAGSSFMVSPK